MNIDAMREYNLESMFERFRVIAEVKIYNKKMK